MNLFIKIIVCISLFLPINCFAESWIIKNDPIYRGEIEITENRVKIEIYNSFPTEHFCLITSGVLKENKIYVFDIPVAKIKITEKTVFIEQLITDLQICKYNEILRVVNPSENELNLWKETLNYLEWSKQ